MTGLDRLNEMFPDGVPLTESGGVPYFVTAMLMADPNDPEDGDFWDEWKDDMKDAEYDAFSETPDYDFGRLADMLRDVEDTFPDEYYYGAPDDDYDDFINDDELMA